MKTDTTTESTALNRIAAGASRPAFAHQPDAGPTTTAVFGRPPQLDVHLTPATTATARRIIRRPFARSRIGYDHSWIGVLALGATLLFGSLAPTSAMDPHDDWTSRRNPTELVAGSNPISAFPLNPVCAGAATIVTAKPEIHTAVVSRHDRGMGGGFLDASAIT